MTKKTIEKLSGILENESAATSEFLAGCQQAIERLWESESSPEFAFAMTLLDQAVVAFEALDEASR